MSELMCPQCGLLFARKDLVHETLIPEHTEQVGPDLLTCRGTEQHPRNPESDGRILWNGKPNPHYYRRVES